MPVEKKWGSEKHKKEGKKAHIPMPVAAKVKTIEEQLESIGLVGKLVSSGLVNEEAPTKK